MGGAVFADAGSLWDASDFAKKQNGQTDPVTGQKFLLADSSSIRAAAGISLLWNSPLGPLRADYSFPLMRQQYDVVERFRFGASTKF